MDSRVNATGLWRVSPIKYLKILMYYLLLDYGESNSTKKDNYFGLNR